MSVNTKVLQKKPLLKRFQSVLLVVLILALSVSILHSCQKNRADSVVEVNHIEAQVNTWLNTKKTVQSGGRNERVEQIRKVLDFTHFYSEDAGDGKTYVIIPLKAGFTSAYNQNKNARNYLLITQGLSGKVIKGNIVQFVSSASEIPANTFRAMDKLEKVTVDGSFTFLTIFDRYLYTEAHKNGKLSSFTDVSNKNKATGVVGIGTNSVLTNSQTCTDWWLITTEYYTDGSTNVYSEYLGQTCVNNGGGCLPNEWCEPEPEDPGDGGGDGGSTTYVDDYDYDKKTTWTWQVYKDTILGSFIMSDEKVKGKKPSTDPDGFFTQITHDGSYVQGALITTQSFVENSQNVSFSGNTASASVNGVFYVQFQASRSVHGSSSTTYSALFP